MGSPAARDPGSDGSREQRLLEAFRRYDRAFQAAGPRCLPSSKPGVELARARMDLVLQLQQCDGPVDDDVLAQLARDAEQLLHSTQPLDSDASEPL